MMQAKTLLAASLLLPVAAAAGVLCALGSGASSYKPELDQRPSSDTVQLVGRVNAAVKTICGDHCPEIALFRNSTAPNLMLVADPSQGKLVYSPQFFAAVFDSFGDNGITAVIAHEVGHALDDSFGAAWVKKSWTPELRADAWAGCVLAKMNLAGGGVSTSLTALSKYPSPAHPAWAQRLPVIRTGYAQCGGDLSKFQAPK